MFLGSICPTIRKEKRSFNFFVTTHFFFCGFFPLRLILADFGGRGLICFFWAMRGDLNCFRKLWMAKVSTEFVVPVGRGVIFFGQT